MCFLFAALSFAVIALCVGAYKGSSAFHEQAAALGAFFLYRFVPEDLIAVGISAAAVEGLALPAALYYYIFAALGALYAG